ncbi:MAG: glycoside hydrolase family 20 zincin-like fold domain-containing protein, partial [Pseudomonadales bacterium]|nr:glycoside hydrolase family 20 zincin-like fold domain-containing protein [Pseudomonadales bacterium]
MTFALYPPVKKLRIRQDAFCLDQRRYISISNPCSDRLAASIHRFQSQLTSNTELTFGKPAEASVLLWIDISATKTHRTITRPGTHNIRPNLRAAGKKIEDYEITCSKDSLRINASSEAGVNSALQTLAQIFEHVLLETEPLPLTALPCFSISDWPDIKARGVMLDISRTKVPTMDTLLTLIDQFSTLKYNQIQLYTE